MIVGKFAVFVTGPSSIVQVPVPSDLFETMHAKHPEKLAGVYDSNAELFSIDDDVATVAMTYADVLAVTEITDPI